MKVLFVCDKEFLRTAHKTNPFYDPIIETCRRNGIDYSILLDKNIPCGYDANRVRSYQALWQCSKWFWRLMHVFTRKSVSEVNTLFGRCARILWKRRFSADVIITIGGALSEFIQALAPDKRIVDIQHGVIYSMHSGYFNEDGSLIEAYREFANREFWLYGQGYADCFFKNPENHKWLDGRVKVIGDVVRAENEVEKVGGGGQRRLVVVASQMTTDFDIEMLAKVKAIYERFMDGLKGAKGVRVAFRHHPRFGNAIDLSDWESRYDWVGFGDKRPWSDIYAEALCVATINSTCAFDAAAQGVPTVLLDGTSLGWNNMMVDEYDYPLRDLSVTEILAMPEKDWSAVRDRLKKWYNTYYTPFSPERALRLLKGEI